MATTGPIKLGKLQALGIKTEATQNTAIALTTVDYIMAEKNIPRVITDKNERNLTRETLNPLTWIPGKTHQEIDVAFPIQGSSLAGTPFSPLDAALQACGMGSVVVASTSVTNQFKSLADASHFGPGKAATIESYQGGGGPSTPYLKHIMAGCIAASAKVNINAAGIGIFEAKYHGLYAAVTDAAAPTTEYNDETDPPILVSAGLTIHGITPVVASIEIDFGLEIAMRDDANGATGVRGFVHVGRKPKGSILIEAEKVSVHDVWGKLVSGADGSILFTLGQTAGNKSDWTLAECQYEGAEYELQNGKLMHKISFACTDITIAHK